jgi:hypothetical protein
MSDVTVRAHGPVFDGRAEAAASAFAHDAAEKIAQEGAKMVREALHGVIRHPTGYYESHVRAEQHTVTDGGVIYGPWLEGVGSRNRTTRFKGYFTFRRTTQQIQAKASEIAERDIPPYLERMR